MNLKYIIPKYKKYWFQRRPPKNLHHLLGAKTIRLNLHTSDLSTAVAKRDAICNEWATMLKENTPSESYQHHMSLWSRLKADITEQEAPLINDDIWSELDEAGAQTAVDAQKVLANFSAFDQAGFHALQNLKNNTPPPAEFTYSLRDGLNAIVVDKEGTISTKFLAKYGSVVDLFVGKGKDRSLYDIRKPEVVQWASKLSKAGKSNSTINTYLSTLATNYTHATDWGKIPDDRVNPFKKIKLKSQTVASFKFMTDEMLTEILSHLDPKLHLQAVLARNIGCRLSEMFKSTLETHEGIVCLNMYDGKNVHSDRLVPIPLFLLDEVVAAKPNWADHERYGRLFSAAKQKVTDDHQLAFHSLRGTFVTHAGRAGFSEQQIAHVVGHADGKGKGHTGKTYFKGYELSALQAVIENTPQYRPE
jgi:site-specific recombinase XerD